MHRVSFVCLLALASCILVVGSPPLFKWGGGGANGNWSTSENWTCDTNPRDPQKTFCFAGTSNLNAVNDFPDYSTGHQISFDVDAGNFTLIGNSVDFYDYGGVTSRIVNYSNNLQIINFQTSVMNSTMGLVAVNGNLVFSDKDGKGIYLNNNTCLTTIANAGKKIIISQVINNGSGGSVGGLDICGTLEGADGTGTVILDRANTYIGATTIHNGATQQLGNGITNGSIAIGSNIVNNGSLVFNRSDTVTQGIDFSGQAITGNGCIINDANGKLLLLSHNIYTGGVTLKSGTLGMGENCSLGISPLSPAVLLTFAGNSTLQFQQTPINFYDVNRCFAINAGVTATMDTQDYSAGLDGTVSGSAGALVKVGNGSLTHRGANTYGGGTTISAGCLIMGNAAALGSPAASLTLNGGAENSGGIRCANPSLKGYSVSASTLTSYRQSSFTGFNLGSNALFVSGAANVSGVTYIGINNATSAVADTYQVITAANGLGDTFWFTGAQDLAVPVNSIIASKDNGYSRLRLKGNGAALQVVVCNDVPSSILNIMAPGASIMFGTSATDTAKNGDVITSYNGGGYRTQLSQNIVNDGRFNPNFLGSQSRLGAINASGANLLTTVGQTASEGHPGYRTSQILYNLNNNDGHGSANKGFWLSPKNSQDPDYVILNVGGNDFISNDADTNALRRLDAILSEVASLRPNATTIATNLMYRTDVAGPAANVYFNPHLQEVVFNHVLTAHNTRYLDLYGIFTPGDSQALLSSDGVHPNQAVYNQMADAIYHSMVYGAAYWKGAQVGNWSTGHDSYTNWVMDRMGTTERGKYLDDLTAIRFIQTDIFFNYNSSVVETTVHANTRIRSLNFSAGATDSLSVEGPGTLTIGTGGITLQEDTGSHSISANIMLGADQIWGNVSDNHFTVFANIGGSCNLAITGSYSTHTADTFTTGRDGDTYEELVKTNIRSYSGNGMFILTGKNAYTGTTTVNGGTLMIDGGSIDFSNVTVNNAGTVLASGATGSIGHGVTVNTAAILAPGGRSTVGKVTVGSAGLSMSSGSTFDWDLATGDKDGTYDTVSVNGELNIAEGVVTSTEFSDPSWNASHTWTGIFGGKAIDNFLVKNFLYSGSATAPSKEGLFTVSASSLTWTPVPEPSTILVDLLIGAGLLGRRRH